MTKKTISEIDLGAFEKAVLAHAMTTDNHKAGCSWLAGYAGCDCDKIGTPLLFTTLPATALLTVLFDYEHGSPKQLQELVKDVLEMWGVVYRVSVTKHQPNVGLPYWAVRLTTVYGLGPLNETVSHQAPWEPLTTLEDYLAMLLLEMKEKVEQRLMEIFPPDEAPAGIINLNGVVE